MVRIMTEQCSRFSVVLLGSGGVGKSSILNRYLHQSFNENYTETVEDTYVQSYNINGRYQYIHFIDTAGNIQFPAMRQIYISQSKGFILVYSVANAESFVEMQNMWEQIKQVRTNVLTIPCVIVGNFLDTENKREVETFDALNWAYNENLGGCFLEVSAKEENGIKDIFDILLEQLGNIRAQQDGQFRIRSTSFTRKLEEGKSINGASEKRRFFRKPKPNSYDQVSTSNKSFQDLAFDDYKESNIYRIISHQDVRSDNFRKVCDENKNIPTRRVSLPALQPFRIDGSKSSCKLNVTKNGNAEMETQILESFHKKSKEKILSEVTKNSGTIKLKVLVSLSNKIRGLKRTLRKTSM